jgi:hypothetical protein
VRPGRLVEINVSPTQDGASTVTGTRSSIARRSARSIAVPRTTGKASNIDLPISSARLLPKCCSAAALTTVPRHSLSTA